MRRRHLLLGGLAALPCPALAQSTRAWAPPTRMIIPYGAGNITDVVARVLLDVLGQRHGWRTAAEN